MGHVNTGHEDEGLNDLDEALSAKRVTEYPAIVLRQDEFLGSYQGGHVDQDGILVLPRLR